MIPMTSHLFAPSGPRRLRARLHLTALCAGAMWLSACGAKVAFPAECSTEGDALPTEPVPDLGPDAVVCGEPGDWAFSDESVAALAGCQIFRGGFSFVGNLTDVSPLASLRVVEGEIRGRAYTPTPDTLHGLEQVQAVGKLDFDVVALRDFTGIRNLREVEGPITIKGMPNLTRLDGLERLQTAGSLGIFNNPALVSIDNLTSLREVDGNLFIAGNPELTELGCLASLERVTGDVTIADNPKVPHAQIEALLSRIEVGGKVHVD